MQYIKSALHPHPAKENMRDRITHSGIIDKVEDDCISVRIIQTSACASCKVAGYCNAAESKEKLVDVYGHGFKEQFTEGESVIVIATKDVANKALIIGFGIPFVLLVSVLFVSTWLLSDETLGAIIAMSTLIPYYFVLYLLRDRMRSNMTFHVEKEEY